MIRMLMVVVMLAMAVTVSAQPGGGTQFLPNPYPYERHIDLSMLGLGEVDTPLPVETDGVMDTEEYLVREANTGLYHVVALRVVMPCACEVPLISAGFYPAPRPSLPGVPYPTLSVWRVKGIDKLMYQASKVEWFQYALPTP